MLPLTDREEAEALARITPEPRVILMPRLREIIGGVLFALVIIFLAGAVG